MRSRSLSGHAEGASCVELSPNQKSLYSGGLDKTVRVWDLAAGKERAKFEHNSQVFSLSVSSDETHLVTGSDYYLFFFFSFFFLSFFSFLFSCSTMNRRLESSDIELINLAEPTHPRQTLHRHVNCVLSVKFAPSKKWFVSTGKDGLLAGWRNPTCTSLFEERETSSILCAEVSGCGGYIITGSGDQRAALYSVTM